MKITTDIGIWTFLWIFIWVILALVDVPNYGGISVGTFAFVSVFLFFFLLSYLFFKSNYKVDMKEINDSGMKYVKFVCVIITIIYIPILLKTFSVLGSMNVWEYRDKAFGNQEEASIIFGSQGARILYTLFIEGGVYFIQFVMLSFYIKTKKIKYLLWGLFYVLIMCFVMLGRSPLYYYLLLSVFSVVYVRKGRISLFVPIVIALFTTILFVITDYRSGWVTTFPDFLNKYLLGYHLYGFNLLEKSGGFSDLIPETLWLGQATFGSFTYFIIYPFAKTFSPAWLYFSSESYTQKNNFVQLIDGTEANAFYTIFYDMYADFSWLAPIIFGVVFGMIYGVVSKNVKKNENVYNLILLLFLLNISFGMIFRNPLATNGFVGFFIYYIIFYITGKYSWKKGR
ncbi:TPA: O-antigen polymerase [Serratia fonticola]